MLFGLDDLFEAVVEDFALPVIVAGVGAVLLAPVLVPVGKPLAKAAIKGSFRLYEKSKVAFAEMGEAFADLVAEAKTDMAVSTAQLQLAPGQMHPEDTGRLG
ncbi:DUF5132 domain-containing protein [Kamptonema formosum]|uniref:DUF5132 domain-containing protein n=1 Tax=Kamptonema formosum TaxID=331992 RepID=UPI000344AB28|nr:DUF5132 domain-containing protein [Oscillatoria sp. PCC 10802]